MLSLLLLYLSTCFHVLSLLFLPWNGDSCCPGCACQAFQPPHLLRTIAPNSCGWDNGI